MTVNIFGSYGKSTKSNADQKLYGLKAYINVKKSTVKIRQNWRQNARRIRVVVKFVMLEYLLID